MANNIPPEKPKFFNNEDGDGQGDIVDNYFKNDCKNQANLLSFYNNWDLELETKETLFQNALEQPGMYEELKKTININILKIQNLAKDIEQRIEEQQDQNIELELEFDIKEMVFIMEKTRQLIHLMKKDIDEVIAKATQLMIRQNQSTELHQNKLTKHDVDLLDLHLYHFFHEMDEIDNDKLIQSRIEQEKKDANFFIEQIDQIQFNEKIAETLKQITFVDPLESFSLMNHDIESKLDTDRIDILSELKSFIDEKINTEIGQALLNIDDRLNELNKQICNKMAEQTFEFDKGFEAKLDNKLQAKFEHFFNENNLKNDILIQNLESKYSNLFENALKQKMEIVTLEFNTRIDLQNKKTSNDVLLLSTEFQKFSNDFKLLEQNIDGKLVRGQMEMKESVLKEIGNLKNIIDTEMLSYSNKNFNEIVDLKIKIDSQNSDIIKEMSELVENKFSQLQNKFTSDSQNTQEIVSKSKEEILQILQDKTTKLNYDIIEQQNEFAIQFKEKFNKEIGIEMKNYKGEISFDVEAQCRKNADRIEENFVAKLNSMKPSLITRTELGDIENKIINKLENVQTESMNCKFTQQESVLFQKINEMISQSNESIYLKIDNYIENKISPKLETTKKELNYKIEKMQLNMQTINREANENLQLKLTQIQADINQQTTNMNSMNNKIVKECDSIQLLIDENVSNTTKKVDELFLKTNSQIEVQTERIKQIETKLQQNINLDVNIQAVEQKRNQQFNLIQTKVENLNSQFNDQLSKLSIKIDNDISLKTINLSEEFHLMIAKINNEQKNLNEKLETRMSNQCTQERIKLSEQIESKLATMKKELILINLSNQHESFDTNAKIVDDKIAKNMSKCNQELINIQNKIYSKLEIDLKQNIEIGDKLKQEYANSLLLLEAKIDEFNQLSVNINDRLVKGQNELSIKVNTKLKDELLIIDNKIKTIEDQMATNFEIKMSALNNNFQLNNENRLMTELMQQVDRKCSEIIDVIIAQKSNELSRQMEYEFSNNVEQIDSQMKRLLTINQNEMQTILHNAIDGKVSVTRKELEDKIKHNQTEVFDKFRTNMNEFQLVLREEVSTKINSQSADGHLEMLSLNQQDQFDKLQTNIHNKMSILEEQIENNLNKVIMINLTKVFNQKFIDQMLSLKQIQNEHFEVIKCEIEQSISDQYKENVDKLQIELTKYKAEIIDLIKINIEQEMQMANADFSKEKQEKLTQMFETIIQNQFIQKDTSFLNQLESKMASIKTELVENIEKQRKQMYEHVESRLEFMNINQSKYIEDNVQQSSNNLNNKIAILTDEMSNKLETEFAKSIDTKFSNQMEILQSELLITITKNLNQTFDNQIVQLLTKVDADELEAKFTNQLENINQQLKNSIQLNQLNNLLSQIENIKRDLHTNVEQSLNSKISNVENKLQMKISENVTVIQDIEFRISEKQIQFFKEMEDKVELTSENCSSTIETKISEFISKQTESQYDQNQLFKIEFTQLIDNTHKQCLVYINDQIDHQLKQIETSQKERDETNEIVKRDIISDVDILVSKTMNEMETKLTQRMSNFSEEIHKQEKTIGSKQSEHFENLKVQLNRQFDNFHIECSNDISKQIKQLLTQQNDYELRLRSAIDDKIGDSTEKCKNTLQNELKQNQCKLSQCISDQFKIVKQEFTENIANQYESQINSIDNKIEFKYVTFGKEFIDKFKSDQVKIFEDKIQLLKDQFELKLNSHESELSNEFDRNTSLQFKTFDDKYLQAQAEFSESHLKQLQTIEQQFNFKIETHFYELSQLINKSEHEMSEIIQNTEKNFGDTLRCEIVDFKDKIEIKVIDEMKKLCEKFNDLCNIDYLIKDYANKVDRQVCSMKKVVKQNSIESLHNIQMEIQNYDAMTQQKANIIQGRINEQQRRHSDMREQMLTMNQTIQMMQIISIVMFTFVAMFLFMR